MKLRQIAQHIQGQVAGDPELEISGVAIIESAGPGDITFFNNSRYRRHLQKTRAAAIILANQEDLPAARSGIIAAHPYLAFAHALELFHSPQPPQRRIHPSAVIDPDATIGERVAVGPFSVIDAGVVIGDDVTILSHCHIYPDAVLGNGVLIHSHSVVRERCRLGNGVIVQNGVVIGSDGFGYARRPDSTWHKILQTGTVVIEDDVEIGSGATIDRATLGMTIIRQGSKIDNLVQIGHGSTVGENTLLCAQVGLAGSTDVGNNVILSGQVGAAGHLRIGDGVVATAQSGIPNSVPEGKIVSGYPAIENRNWLKSSAIFAALPQLLREVQGLSHRLGEVEKKWQVNEEKPSQGTS
jgi:UDP-3-O-[3-hydroxymyristoyl] glucosamine N-acyltransferase